MTGRPDLTRSPEILALVGFMGAGKSTVGRLLARRLGWTFIDTDEAVARASGRSIAEIFRSEGEAGFRRREHDAVRAACAGRRVVVAVGGGAMAEAVTRRLLLERSVVVYLAAGEETLMARLGSDLSDDRPLLAGDGGAPELLRRRRPSYETAHHTIATDALGPEETAEAVHAWWLARDGGE